MNHYCQKASQLLSERLDRPLRLGERLHLWIHLAMCRLCRDNAHAMGCVHQLVRESVDKRVVEQDDPHLNRQQRDRIATALRSESGE
ncbi:MAG: hypothetical protein Q9M13_04885 [Mariprofundales bacterium]|nr:hypothetical protein [Mariprofundales bacterium]